MLAGLLLFVAFNMGESGMSSCLRHFTVQYRTLLVGTFVMTNARPQWPLSWPVMACTSSGA